MATVAPTEAKAHLSDPAAIRAVAVSEADLAAGRVEDMDDVTSALERQRIVPTV